MSRRDEFKSTSKNPATKFLEWKSDLQALSYYDKEQGQNIEVKLPFKFLVLKEMHTVKGWDDASGSGIYANEVVNIGQDQLTVKSFKGGVLAKGIYKDIKPVIEPKGAHYSKSIYALLDGEIVNLQFKGACVQSWGDFTQKARKRLPDEFVTIVSAEERVKGKVKYSVPVFQFTGVISKEEDVTAEAKYKELEEYFSGYLSNEAVSDETSNEPAPEKTAKARILVDLNHALFPKIKAKMEADPTLTIMQILEHYDLTPEAITELEAVAELPF
ncbi:MAG: hypothetical protein NXI00_12220 [Cytophagales bacterium]|nr:hypothetical protein [Cytophagales bacterium]